jgi:archaellum biogenesis ATPase FlaH
LTAREVLTQAGVEFRDARDEFEVKECFVCGDSKFHLYVNQETGAFYCHKSNCKGSMLDLKRGLGLPGDQIRQLSPKPIPKPALKKKVPLSKVEALQAALSQDQKSLDYLRSRGISRESIRTFRLGLMFIGEERWLSTPHYRGNQVLNIKYRRLPPHEKTFNRVKGSLSILFNETAIRGTSELLLTEGETDAITLLQAGMENVVGTTGGAGTFDAEWLDQLKDVKKIYLCYDADDAGRIGAKSAAKRLGYDRCYNVQLPEGQDVNDYFLTEGQDIFTFQRLLLDSRKYDLDGIITAAQALELLELHLKDKTQGLTTPWPSVNRIVKGFFPGDLVIVSAPPKTGKTTWCLDIAMDLVRQKIPVLIYCLEMASIKLIVKVMQNEHRTNEVSEQHREESRKIFNDNYPMYFNYRIKAAKLNGILDLMRECIKRHDIKLVIFDNLHFLVRSITNVNEELGQAVQGFKLLAEEMEIPVIAIAQPRKKDSKSKDEIMSADDIKYSNSIHADCDKMIIMHRKRIASTAKDISSGFFKANTQSQESMTLIRAEADRYGSGGETVLNFRGELSRFEEISRGGF